ncbi:20803_t:CDS:2 [Rhizophagus irregularis]|nr:20803_t:CDS:2 [Rhizophagus irregularis]
MERTKNIKYEGMVNSKKLTDIEKNLRETHQIIFVSSDFKETNKEDDNNDEELRPDSEHITPLSVALEIRYDVKSSEFVSENKNLELKLRSISIETDTPINTALPKKNYLHIKGDVNLD